MSVTTRLSFHAAVLAAALSLAACSSSPAAGGGTPTPSPSVNPTPTPSPSGHWVMGYVVGYERDLLPLDAVNWKAMTHVAVGRARPLSDGSITTDFDIDTVQGPTWAKSVVSHAHQNGVKAILMLGGAGEHDGFASAASSAHRDAFVQRIRALVQTYGFDGVDLDWEPIDSADAAPLKALVTALRAAKPDLILTLPVNYVNVNFPDVEARPFFADLAAQLDQINIMSYGMAGDYEGWHSWHSSALMGEGESTPSSVSSSVDAYLAVGVPAQKLGVGIGFYGLCYQGVKGPGQASNNMHIVADDGDMSYANIMTSYSAAATKLFDPTAQVPYLSSDTPLGDKACTYISYEDARSIAAKGAYAKAKGLGGTIIWTVAQGHQPGQPAGAQDPLLNAAQAAFR